jgi:hypothetical protein
MACYGMSFTSFGVLSNKGIGWGFLSFVYSFRVASRIILLSRQFEYKCTSKEKLRVDECLFNKTEGTIVHWITSFTLCVCEPQKLSLINSQSEDINRAKVPEPSKHIPQNPNSIAYLTCRGVTAGWGERVMRRPERQNPRGWKNNILNEKSSTAFNKF